MAGDGDPLIPDTEVRYLRSEHVGDEFRIWIGHCGSEQAPGSGVLFLGDPWANFGTAVEVTRLLRFTESTPPLLVVGIGHRATLEKIIELRARDFTPTPDPAAAYRDQDILGGADRFLGFLHEELKPWVREQYGADPEDSILFGDSLGGLFATYVLLTRPEVFPRYGIGSPSLWWDKELLFRLEEKYAQSHDDLPAKVHVSVGAYENAAGRRRFLEQLPADARAKGEAEDASDPPVDMVGGAERMVTALRRRGYPSLDVEYEVLEGEYHDTAPPLNVSRSLRFLLGTPR